MKIFFKVFSIILSLFLANATLSNSCQAQEFTFADTHPVNNLDSLERWLIKHPTINNERLQNLIALERTYDWQYSYKRNTKLDTIENISKTLNSKVGMASLNYLRGVKGIYEIKTGAFKSLVEALTAFETLKDISGQIHCNSAIALINFDGATQVIGEKKIAQNYLENARLLLKQSNQLHDKFHFKHISARVAYNSKNLKELKISMTDELDLVKKYPKLRYGYIKAKITEALYYHTQNNFQKSANIYEEILKNIAPQNYYAQITCYYNLGNDYSGLGLYQKASDAYKMGIDVFLKSGLKYYPPIKFIYQSYRENAQIHHDYQLANSLADSLLKYEKISNDNIKTNELIELEAKNLLEKKEIEVELLKQRQTLLFIALVVGLFFLGMVIYFVFRLKQSNNKIQELTKYREQFYTIIAHDLREPINNLSAVSTAIKFLIKNKREADLQKVLDNIDNHARKSLLLVNNLLEWGISKNYQTKNNTQEVDVSKLIHDISDYYSYIIKAKNISIITNLTDDIKLYTYPKAFEIIIRNLIDNAQKFTNEGGKIEVSAQRILNQKQVRIEVKNTGIIKEEKLKYIKKVFSNQLKPEVGVEGIGLGIVLISSFVEKINGQISVESSVEHDTAFSIILSTD